MDLLASRESPQLYRVKIACSGTAASPRFRDILWKGPIRMLNLLSAVSWVGLSEPADMDVYIGSALDRSLCYEV